MKPGPDLPHVGEAEAPCQPLGRAQGGWSPHRLDINAIVGGYLRDLAFAHQAEPRMFGYKRAAAAVFALDTQLFDLVADNDELPKIAGIGPASTRVIREVLLNGFSPTVEQAVARSGRRADIERGRSLRLNFLSRAEVLRILRDPDLDGPSLHAYRGDLQMHSEWSDGKPTLEELSVACQGRGYAYAAVTDHSYRLKIAGGMSMAEAHEQRAEIARVNAATGDRFRLLQGIEANIGGDGHLDLPADEASAFEIVLAAAHSRLRKEDDQTGRLITAIETPQVRVLAHPRGRLSGSRAGVAADWDAVFAAAAQRAVAIEIDGDPARQDLDFALATRALAAGCVFALDSDAHTTTQLGYAETALAHARLARIPAERIVNCWPLDRLLAWLESPHRECAC